MKCVKLRGQCLVILFSDSPGVMVAVCGSASNLKMIKREIKGILLFDASDTRALTSINVLVFWYGVGAGAASATPLPFKLVCQMQSSS
jgi:hypothetical protein